MRHVTTLVTGLVTAKPWFFCRLAYRWLAPWLVRWPWFVAQLPSSYQGFQVMVTKETAVFCWYPKHWYPRKRPFHAGTRTGTHGKRHFRLRTWCMGSSSHCETPHLWALRCWRWPNKIDGMSRHTLSRESVFNAMLSLHQKGIAVTSDITRSPPKWANFLQNACKHRSKSGRV